MGPIKVVVRIRPNIASEVTDTTPIIDVKSDTTLQLSRPNEAERVFDRVLRDSASGGSVWDDVGSPAVSAMEKGEFASIVVYGQTGAGKTHTLTGEGEGLVNYMVRRLAGNAESNMAVLMIRNECVVDLVDVELNNLKLRVDDNTGTTAERATTVRIPTEEAGMEHLSKCLASRDELLEKAGSHGSLVFTVYCFQLGEGQLNIIECPGSERVFQAHLSDDQRKELDAKTKTLSQFVRCCHESAVSSDAKAVGFRDTKAGRFLQPGLSQAMEGKGFTAFLVAVFNQKEHLYETMCSLNFAECAVKQDGLKSVSEYKEKIEYLEERLEENEKLMPAMASELKVAEAAAARAKSEIEVKMRDLDEKSKALDARVAQTKAQCAADVERTKKDIERKREALLKAHSDETLRLANLSKNAPAQAEADAKKAIAEVEAKHKESVAEMKAEIEKLKAEISENEEFLGDLREEKKKRESDEEAAMAPVRALEAELAKVLQEVEDAGPTREDGLTEEQILERQPLWDARDELDELQEKVQTIALECMEIEYGLQNKVGLPVDSDASSTESSTGSTTSDSDATTSTESSESEASDTEESEEDEVERITREEAARKLEEERERARAEEEQLDKEAYEREMAHFRETIRKDQFLGDLVEKILTYLEYGTNVTVAGPKGFGRQFLYMGRNRKAVCLTEEVAEGKQPNKKTPQRVVPIEWVVGLHLGHHSPNFQTLLKKVSGRTDPPRDEQPPPPDEISEKNMHKYYYRSFSLQLKADEGWVDVVCDSPTDFEALVVGIHRITTKDASWGKKLYLDFCEDVDKLLPFEKDFCELVHFTPKQYLAAKDRVLGSDEKLFVTLHDIRVLTGLDLFHSQKIFEMFVKQGWLTRRQLYYFKYQERLMASAQAAQERSKAAKAAAAAEDKAKEETMDDLI